MKKINIPNLFLQTDRLIIATLSDEYDGSKTNFAFKKNEHVNETNFDLSKLSYYFDNSYVVGYINIDANGYIEYSVYKPHRNNGYAKEMLQAVKDFCIINSLSPQLYIDTKNEVSKKTASSCGFVYESQYDSKFENFENWVIK